MTEESRKQQYGRAYRHAVVTQVGANHAIEFVETEDEFEDKN